MTQMAAASRFTDLRVEFIMTSLTAIIEIANDAPNKFELKLKERGISTSFDWGETGLTEVIEVATELQRYDLRDPSLIAGFSNRVKFLMDGLGKWVNSTVAKIDQMGLEHSDQREITHIIRETTCILGHIEGIKENLKKLRR